MSEEPNIETPVTPEVVAPIEEVVEEVAEVLPGALREVDAEKMALLREKLKKFTQSDEKTVSGSEATAEGTPDEGTVNDGSKVDWSEYKLDYNIRHLYQRAMYRETGNGPKWVAMVDEFYSTSKDARQYEKKVKGGPNGTDEEPLNLGKYLGDMLNSVEGWKLVSLLPGMSGQVNVLLQRTVPIALPDPEKIVKETEVEAPTDPELAQVQAAADAFMAGEGLTPEQQTVIDQAIQHTASELEAQALALNPPTERDPVTAQKQAAINESRVAARQASAALQGEDFGSLEPWETQKQESPKPEDMPPTPAEA